MELNFDNIIEEATKCEEKQDKPNHGYKSDSVYRGIMELKNTLISKGLL